jgi:glycosyltransferase involved in cell wall biosynthesis
MKKIAILSRLHPSDYYLIASLPQQSNNNAFHLQSRLYSLPPEPSSRFGIQRIRNIANLFIGFLTRTRNLLPILRHEPTRAIVACSGDLMNIPAAFLASRLVHIPFYGYIFDDYVYQFTGNYRRFAKIFASLIFKHAAGIIAPNEYMCEEYRLRYGVRPTMVRNPCDENELNKKHLISWPLSRDQIKIIYTGAIYHANYDCFRNLLGAMKILQEYPLELHIFTAQTRQQLSEQGLAGERIVIFTHVPYDDILEHQRKADILFLPLTFEPLISEVIRTSAPGKLGEYLASGRPILAHIPADSYVADYCERYDCAAIASQNNPTVLAREIKHIISDSNFRIRITNNALSRASIDFHPQQASEQLMRLLDSEKRAY